MMEIEPFYRIYDLQPTSSGYFPIPPAVDKVSTDNFSELYYKFKNRYQLLYYYFQMDLLFVLAQVDVTKFQNSNRRFNNLTLILS